MKKFLLILVALMFLFGVEVQAKTFKVLSVDKFSTASPSNTYKVQVIEREELSDGSVYEAGTIISGNVIKIKNPTRGKRDAYFEFVPTEITLNNKTQTIQDPKVYAKVVGYAPIDPKAIAGQTIKGAIGFVFKGASEGISFIQGAVKNENGNPLKSGFVKLYKDSPLAYFEEGKELNINEGDLILLKLKKIKDEL